MTARSRRRRQSARLYSSPPLAVVALLAVGLLTWQLEASARLTLLWLVQVGVLLATSKDRPLELGYRPADVGRGVLVGAVPALAILLLAGGLLRTVAGRFYPGSDAVAIFQQAVLIAAPVEELFFRGFVQERWNIWAGVIGYALLGVVCVLPTAVEFPLVLLLVAGGWTGLGLLFAYVRRLYGLAAAVAAHACVATLVLVLPLALADLGL